MASNVTGEESQYYDWLFRLCDLDHDGRISASDHLYMQKSGLSGLQLDQVPPSPGPPVSGRPQVWEVAVKASKLPRNLDLPAFHLAMRLVAAAQAGLDVRSGDHGSAFRAMPQFGPVTFDTLQALAFWSMSDEQRAGYETFFSQQCNTETMGGGTAAQLLQQYSSDRSVLCKIWALVDRRDRGALDSVEFGMALHMVQCSSQGFEVPNLLPPNLLPPAGKASGSKASQAAKKGASPFGDLMSGMGGKKKSTPAPAPAKPQETAVPAPAPADGPFEEIGSATEVQATPRTLEEDAANAASLDPFGAGPSGEADPFGADPSAEADPFGAAEAGPDPFETGAGGDGDPFGDPGSAGPDPFGASAANEQPGPFGASGGPDMLCQSGGSDLLRGKATDDGPFQEVGSADALDSSVLREDAANAASLDPFGDGPSGEADPFGADPSAEADPFGAAEAGPDPFETGAGGDSDPFGDPGTAGPDPFGATSTELDAAGPFVAEESGPGPFVAESQPIGLSAPPPAEAGPSQATVFTSDNSPFATDTLPAEPAKPAVAAESQFVEKVTNAPAVQSPETPVPPMEPFGTGYGAPVGGMPAYAGDAGVFGGGMVEYAAPMGSNSGPFVTESKPAQDGSSQPEQLAAVQNEKSVKQNELAGLEQQIGAASTEVKDLEAELGNVQESNSLLDNKIRQAQATLEELKRKKAGAQSQLSAAAMNGNASGQELSELQVEIETLQLQVESRGSQLSEEQSQLKDAQGESAEIAQQVQSLNEELLELESTLEQTVKAKDKEVQALEEQRVKMQALEQEKQSREEKLEKAKAEHMERKKQFTDQLLKIRGDVAAQKSLVAEQKQEHGAMQKEKEQLRVELQQAQQELKALNKQTKQLEYQVSQDKYELIQQQSDLQHTQAAVSEAREDPVQSNQAVDFGADNDDLHANFEDLLPGSPDMMARFNQVCRTQNWPELRPGQVNFDIPPEVAGEDVFGDNEPEVDVFAQADTPLTAGQLTRGQITGGTGESVADSPFDNAGPSPFGDDAWGALDEPQAASPAAKAKAKVPRLPVEKVHQQQKLGGPSPHYSPFENNEGNDSPFKSDVADSPDDYAPFG